MQSIFFVEKRLSLLKIEYHVNRDRNFINIIYRIIQNYTELEIYQNWYNDNGYIEIFFI